MCAPMTDQLEAGGMVKREPEKGRTSSESLRPTGCLCRGWTLPGQKGDAESARSTAVAIPTLGSFSASSCRSRARGSVPLYAGRPGPPSRRQVIGVSLMYGASWTKRNGKPRPPGDGAAAVQCLRQAEIIEGKVHAYDASAALASPWYQIAPRIETPSSGTIMLFQSVDDFCVGAWAGEKVSGWASHSIVWGRVKLREWVGWWASARLSERRWVSWAPW